MVTMDPGEEKTGSAFFLSSQITLLATAAMFTISNPYAMYASATILHLPA
jgi:hypothetical protein